MINFQKTDEQFAAGYLSCYAGGTDEKRQVVFKPTAPKEKASGALPVTIQARELHHEKITRAHAASLEFLKKNHAPDALAREMPVTEMIWYSQDLPYIMTNLEFVHCSTRDPEHRLAVERRHAGIGRKLLHDDGVLIPVRTRQVFPAWRQFTANQVLFMREAVESRYYVDKTSSFSLRPPELHCFCTLKDYLRIFSFKSVGRYEAAEVLRESPWIDGSGNQVRIRQIYLQEAATWLNEYRDDDRFSSGDVLALVQDLLLEEHNDVKSPFYERFVDTFATKHVVFVPTSIDPQCFNKFLVHLLLTLGEFITEIDLFTGNSLLDAFENARMIKDAQNPTDEEALIILRSWLMWNMRVMPKGNKVKSRYLAIGMDGLRHFFATGNLAYEGMPLASQRAIRLQAEEKIRLLEKSRLQSLAEALLQCTAIANAPSLETITRGQPFNFMPIITRLQGQSRESYAEQNLYLTTLVATIDDY